MMISSISNPRVQAARKLQRRRERAATGRFLIEGPNAVADALAAEWPVLELYVTEGHDDLARACAERDLPVLEVSDAVMRALSDASTPQGVVAVAAVAAFDLEDLEVAGGLVLVLAEVRDPGNAGTLLRTAAAAGCDAVVFTAGSVDPWSPKVVRSAAGATFRVPVVTDVAADAAIGMLGAKGYDIVGTDAASDEDLYSADLSEPIAIVLGNEAWGLSPGIAALVDRKIGIRMPGRAESLNVAVAGAVIVFEALRQRR